MLCSHCVSKNIHELTPKKLSKSTSKCRLVFEWSLTRDRVNWRETKCIILWKGKSTTYFLLPGNKMQLPVNRGVVRCLILIQCSLSEETSGAVMAKHWAARVTYSEPAQRSDGVLLWVQPPTTLNCWITVPVKFFCVDCMFSLDILTIYWVDILPECAALL